MDKEARAKLKAEIAAAVIDAKGSLPMEIVQLPGGRSITLRRKNGKLYRVQLASERKLREQRLPPTTPVVSE